MSVPPEVLARLRPVSSSPAPGVVPPEVLARLRPVRTAGGHARELGVGIPRGVGTTTGLALQGASALEGPWWPRYQEALGAVESVEVDGELPRLERLGSLRAAPAPRQQQTGAFLDRLRARLEEDEGYRDELYRDTTGHLTYGFGHKVLPSEPEYNQPVGTPVPREKSEGAFRADMEEAVGHARAVIPDFDDLPTNAQVATASMAYQMGRQGLAGFEQFRAALQGGDYREAAREMLDSEWAKQTPARARRLAQMVRESEASSSPSAISELDESIRTDMDLPPRLRHVLRASLRRRAAGEEDPLAEARALIPAPVQDRPLYQAGEAVSEAATEAFPRAPGYEDALSGTVGEGLGSLSTFVAAGLVSGPMSLPVVTTLGAAMGAGEATERAIEAGATPEQIAQAAQLGAVAGTSEAAPVEMLLRAVPAPARAALSAVARAGGRVGVQAVTEAIQEGAQSVAQNLIAREVHSPETQLGEGVLPAAGVGGIVGGIAGIGREGVIAIGRRRSTSATGDRARAVNEVREAGPSPEDEASPLRTEDIVAGREEVADGVASGRANQALESAGMTPIGQPVQVRDGMGGTVEAVVTDAAIGEDGSVRGVSVTVPDTDGRFGEDIVIDYSPSELEAQGIRIEGMPMPPAAEERAAAEQAETQQIRDAETEATKQQEQIDRSADGALVLDALAGGSPVADSTRLGEALAGMSGTADGTKMLRALAGTERTAAGDMVMRAVAGQGPQMNAEHLGLALTGMRGSPDGDAVFGALGGVRDEPGGTGTPQQETDDAPETDPSADARQDSAGESQIADDDVALRGADRERPPEGDAAAAEARPLALKKDGTPFKSRGSAMMAARSRKMEGAQAVEVEGGWAIQGAPTSEAISEPEIAESPAVAAEPEPEPETILKADGSPFKSKQSAMLAARNKRLTDVGAVQVEGGWALRRGAEPAAEPADAPVEVQGAQLQRGEAPTRLYRTTHPGDPLGSGTHWSMDADTARGYRNIGGTGGPELVEADLDGRIVTADEMFDILGERPDSTEWEPDWVQERIDALPADVAAVETHDDTGGTAYVLARDDALANVQRTDETEAEAADIDDDDDRDLAQELIENHDGDVDAIRAQVAEYEKQYGAEGVAGVKTALGAPYYPDAQGAQMQRGEALYHGTSFDFAPDKLRPTADGVWDHGGRVSIPVLFLSPDRKEAEYYSTLAGGSESGDAGPAGSPRVLNVRVNENIVDLDNGEFEDWIRAVEDDDDAPLAVRATGSEHVPRGTVVVREGANYQAREDVDATDAESPGAQLQRARPEPQRPRSGTARIRLQRRFSEQQGRVAGDIERIGRDVFGPGFRVKVAESIEAPDGGVAHGAYDPANRIAYIALRADEAGMTGSLYHEGLHHLRNAGAFTDTSGADTRPWQTLEREAVDTWREQYGIDARYGPDTEGMDPAQRERMMNEEAIAEALADYQTRGRETGFGPTVRSALNRLMNFFRRMANGLRGRGFQTWQDVFDADIATGAAGRRTDSQRRTELDRQLMTAWHGSPHKFDKFSTEAIGTGEGAQAFGHGLYFAGKKEVADNYRKLLAPGGRGATYKVDLAPKENEYLLWDEPLRDQPEHIQEGFKAAWKAVGGKLDQLWMEAPGGESYQRMYPYDLTRVNEMAASAAEASAALREAGIRGIKYRDQGSRGKDKDEATYNYVLFDDTDVVIEEVLLQRQAQTPAFKRWFGKSKAVDDAGQPRVLYHGARQDFTEFDPSKGRKLGHWFTSDTEISNFLSETIGEETGGVVYPAHLRMEAPYEVDAQGRRWSRVDKEGGQWRSTDDVARDARDAGYDGVIIRNVVETNVRDAPSADTYVVFDSAQIKSATGNRGTFDIESPNMLFQRAPNPKRDPKGFDDAASKWAGVDLRGAADAVIADKERMGGLAETIKAQVKGVESIKAKNVSVKEAHVAGDLFVGSRWVVPPHHATRKQFPAINALIRSGIESEKKISNWTQRLDKRWDRITKKLSKTEFADLTGALFLGDAEAHVFTDAELDAMDLAPKVKGAYRQSRRLLDAMGTMVENHSRKMTLPALARRTKLIRKLAGAVGADVATFREKFTARSKLLDKQRRGDGDPEELSAAIDKATVALYGENPEARVENRERFESEAAEVDRIDARLADNKIKRRVGYVPHKFFGKWRIFRKVPSAEATVTLGFNGQPWADEKAAAKAAKDKGEGGAEVVKVEGGWGYKSRWQHIAGEHGFWPTRSDAIRAASHMAKKDADGEYQVSQVEFSFPEEEATQLSDAAFFRFLGNVQDLTGLKGDDLREAVAGSARRRFRRRIAGFSQFRKGVKGYSKNLDRVMRTHIGQTVRHIVLDELKFRAINVMEKEGLSENRTTVQSQPELAAMVQSWWRDVNGQKQPLEQGIDAILSKPWASPLKVGAAAGATAFVAAKGVVGVTAIGAGTATGLGVPAIVAGYVGYRVGRALAEGGTFPSRSLMGAALSDMSHLKLGMVFNLMSPAVNVLQTATNTFPVLGSKWTGVGVKRYAAAVQSKIRGKPNADYRQLERANIRALDTFAEGTAHAFKKESKAGQISMAFFTGAEVFNRGVAFLGGMSKAHAEGKTPKEQREYGNEVMDRTQLNYEKAARPEALRNNFARVPLQFKNYVVQQLGFVLGLRGPELARFLGSMTLVAGTLGWPFVDLLDDLVQWVTEKMSGKPWSPIMAMKMAAIDSLGDGSLEGGVMTFLTRGAPGLSGVDFLGRVGMGDKFLPTEMRDFWGPWASTVLNAVRHGQEDVALTDQLRNLSPGIGGPLKALESWANGGEVSNPWKGGKIDYVATPNELALKAIGARPIREARMQDVREQERRETEYRRTQARRLTNAWAKAVKDGDRAKANRILTDANRRGIPLTKGAIRRNLRDRGRVRPERELRALPRDMRSDAAGRRAAIEQAAQ